MSPALTNRWNQFVYRLWAPAYDAVFDRLFASPGRRRSIALLNASRGERVLFVGIGTGADLPLLGEGVSAVGLDLSRHMLARASPRAASRSHTHLVRGDAGQLPLIDGHFDAVVLNLVLSVVPDGAACVQEVLRVLRPNGRVIVFDKFLPDGKLPSAARRLANLVTMCFGTDINRRLADVLGSRSWRIVHDELSLLGGAYRVLVMRPALRLERARQAVAE
jgi:ubiquinone/menaquinone biosynthesis C-methylase UbiE